MSMIMIDEDPGYDKDFLKQKILEHEETFKNQILELHRLYRTQKDMMYEIKRTELHKPWTSMEPSSSSSLPGSHLPPKDGWKCHITTFPVANSSYVGPSLSGTEIVNCPLSSLKVNSVQFGRSQIQNSCSSNICEDFEARPSKVRKKLFDLQLPADDYIDTDEADNQLQDNEGSFCPRSCANGNDRADRDSSSKIFPGADAGTKSDKRDASASNSCLRTSVGLADLNEPAQLEEVTPSPVDLNACAKSNPAFGSKGKEKDWYSSTYETGNIKGILAPLPHSFAQNKLPTPCHPAQVMLDKACLTPGVQSPHHIRDDLWRVRPVYNLETFHRNHEKSNYTYGKPFVTSHTASSYPFSNSSEFTNSWSHTLSSWGKPSGLRLSSGHINPSFNSFAMVSKSPQSPLSNDIFGDKRHINGSSTSNLGLATDLSIRNGFHHGSSSGPKDSPLFLSVDFDSRKNNKGDNLTSECSANNRCEKFFISSNNMDLTSDKGFDLSVLSKSSLDEELCRRDVELVEAKREPQDCIPVFPWLKAKPSFRNVSSNTMKGGNSADSGFIQAHTNSPICGSGPSKNPSNVSYAQNVIPTLEDCNMKVIKEVGGTRSIRKILGVPIPEIPCASKYESSSFVSTSATLHSSPEGENKRHERRNMVIDINIACDVVEPEKQVSTEPVVAEIAMETKATISRNSFDLNSCITEDEDSFFVESNNVNVRTVIEIDLEALPVLETEQDHLSGEDKQNDASLHLPEPKLDKTQDEVVRNAADAIVSISSSSQFNFIDESSSDPSHDPLGSLGWFVDAVFSFDNEFTSKSKEIIAKDAVIVAPTTTTTTTTTAEMDYFETVTLQLEETKEQNYMPKPFVPEVQPVEDAGATSLTKQTRRGNGRWGRQRRDFQRDILPGLASLSRHEVTEDIQIFGELMKAMGHSWNSGSMRRNGSGKRGRQGVVIETAPATVSSPITPPLSLEDKSLTGWGKTTRRPRRQRFPAGHPPAVTLT